MSALKLPQKLACNRANQHLCHRIGIKLNGVDQGAECIAYDVPEGYVLMKNGDRKLGVVAPYWRAR